MPHLKPYPQYKSSGVEWLGDVPTHWGVAAVKRHYAIQLGKMLQNHPNSPADVEVPYLKAQHVQWFSVRTTDAPTMWASPHEIEQFGIQAGDLLVCEGGEGGRGALVEEVPPGYIIQNALHRVRSSGDSRNDYLQYVMNLIAQSGWFDAINNKATIAHFTVEKFGSLMIPLPPLLEQTAIVRYLDQADEHIRRYVSSRERLIELLEEYRQAIIHHAVTRGLDPDVRLKPSGVEWLGDVPAHWEVRRVKQVSRILRGKFTHRPRNEPSLYNGPYPFIQTGDVARAKKTITEYSQTLNKQGLAVSKMFPTGTLVMTIAANIGDVAILDFEACFPDSVVGFVPHQNVDRDYLYYLFRAMKAEFLRETPVNTQGNLNVERIGARHIALPSISEQTAIVAYLDKATADIDAAIDRARREIELLSEYRTRLIADVVTGQMDVRETADGLPDDGDVSSLDFDEIECV